MRALEDTSGRGLEQFFEQWVYRAGHPELEIKIEHEGRTLALNVKQTQKVDKDNPAFAFPLTVEIVRAKGKSVRHTALVAKADEALARPCPESPSFVVAAPDLAVIADVKLEAPADMLRRQLSSAKTARGRWLAAAPLGKRPDEPALRALAEALADEDEFWGTRAEAAAALGSTRLSAAFEHLKAHTKTKHPKVRRAVMQALGS